MRVETINIDNDTVLEVWGNTPQIAEYGVGNIVRQAAEFAKNNSNCRVVVFHPEFKGEKIRGYEGYTPKSWENSIKREAIKVFPEYE
jgi:hypothetical protein